MSNHDKWDFETFEDSMPSWYQKIEGVALSIGHVIVRLVIAVGWIIAIGYLLWREVSIAHFLMGTW